jgi:hypothetical protein
MDSTPADRRRRRLLIATVAGGAVLVALVTVGVYGLLRGPSAADPATQRPGPTTSPTPGPSPSQAPGEETVLAPIPQTGDPEQFARAVAEALFGWDTATGFEPVDYAQVLADVASPVEADWFVADVRAYLPTVEAWGRLRPYQTRQWLTIDTITVPDSWPTALAQAAPGQIPDGTTAFTVDGTRHRAGIVVVTPTETSRRVSFTVFVTCTPAVPDRPASGSCAVLRLSELDNPLR